MTEKRNPKYNCGGYALGTYNWYIPKGETFEEKVQSILEDHPHARRIYDMSEALPNEYIVLFRLSRYAHMKRYFHFIKRGLNKVWYEKNGRLMVKILKADYVFSEEWDCYYKYADPTAMFAVKKKDLKKGKRVMANNIHVGNGVEVNGEYGVVVDIRKNKIEIDFGSCIRFVERKFVKVV